MSASENPFYRLGDAAIEGMRLQKEIAENHNGEVARFVRGQGLPVVLSPLLSRKIGGVLKHVNGKSIILVNGEAPNLTQEISIAHEYFHHALDHRHVWPLNDPREDLEAEIGAVFMALSADNLDELYRDNPSAATLHMAAMFLAVVAIRFEGAEEPTSGQ